jgi:hypothetical protein
MRRRARQRAGAHRVRRIAAWKREPWYRHLIRMRRWRSQHWRFGALPESPGHTLRDFEVGRAVARMLSAAAEADSWRRRKRGSPLGRYQP